MKTIRKEIFLKAWNEPSETYEEYMKIIKRGDLDYDWACFSDDVIQIWTKDKNILDIKIDCDRNTWEFRIFWEE